jgi:hypothetical protein
MESIHPVAASCAIWVDFVFFRPRIGLIWAIVPTGNDPVL